MGLVLTFTFTSCDNDDSSDSGIVGTWSTTYSDEYEKIEQKVTFKSNGTFKAVYTYLDKESGEKDVENISGSYVYDEEDGILIMEDRMGVYDGTYRIEIHGNTMYLYDDEDEDDVVILKRV